MNKLVFTLALSLSIISMGMAQNPGGQGAPGAKAPAGGAKPQGPPPSIGRAYGKVTDSAGQPIAQASALLLRSSVDPATKKKKLSLVKGMETKANGEFDFEDLPIYTQLVLRISATGFKGKDQSFMIVTGQPAPAANPRQNSASPYGNIPSFDKDLGEIRLSGDVKELGAVVVKAAPPAMRLEIDKKVFNVDRNIVSAGGTAVDVMRNVPSVNVDIDGNVSLRGATPTIFVDGRPTTLSLDEIPADAIESVEVMTNPSAKYDASGGGAGILNIVLKKNRKQGYNGQVTAGMDSHGSPNALAGFNIRQNKVNVTVNGLYNAINSKSTGNTDRLSFLRDTTTHILQQDNNQNKGHFLFGQVGMDYFMSNKTTVSASYIKVGGEFKPLDNSNVQTTVIDSLGHSLPTVFSTRNSNSERKFDVNGVQVGMKHLFAKEGEQLTLDGSYFGVTAHSTSLYTTNIYQGDYASKIDTTTWSQNKGTAAPAFFTVQTDYTDPLGKKGKLEAGLRMSIQQLSNDNNTYTLDEFGNGKLDPYGTSNYKSTSTVYAAYANYTGGIKDFGYSLGLRAESSKYTGDLLNTGQHFSNNYPISLFPSIFLSDKLKKNQELQLSATRKINRPGFFQLVPFTDYSDPLNITRGNPDLVPEFTYSFELSYMKTFPHNNTLLVSGYYKYTDNLMTRFQDSGVNPIGIPVLINTYRNANYAYTVGGEVTSTDNITRWWDITANFNLYEAHINTTNLDQPSQEPMLSWFGKFNSNFKLPSNFSVQLTAIFQSKTSLPVNQNSNQFGPPGSTTQSSSQGYIKPFYGVDLAVKKSFMKNNAASVTVSVSDVFRTRWSKQFSQSQFFSQEYDRLKDPQLVRLVFAYHFGKMDLNLFKRKDMNNQGMGDAGSSLQ